MGTSVSILTRKWMLRLTEQLVDWRIRFPNTCSFCPCANCMSSVIRRTLNLIKPVFLSLPHYTFFRGEKVYSVLKDDVMTRPDP